MGFGLDMSKAKDIHRKNIRDARGLKFSELDVEFQKAQETGSNTSSIVAKKQALRDAPGAAGISTAVNAQDLKAQWDTNVLGDSPYS